MELIQFVEAGQTKEKQKVKFPKEKAWWKVAKKTRNEIVLKRGKASRRVNQSYNLLQMPFANL